MADGETPVADVWRDCDRAASRQRDDHGVLDARKEVAVVRPPLQRARSDTRHGKTEAPVLDLLGPIDAVKRKGREPLGRSPAQIALR